MIGSRIEHEQRHPLPTVLGHIPQHPPNGSGVLEVVLADQFLIEAPTLAVFNESHRYSLEQQRLRGGSPNRTIIQMNSHAAIGAGLRAERQTKVLELAAQALPPVLVSRPAVIPAGARW